jgi:imidazolonepropionase-like amidohydrolase
VYGFLIADLLLSFTAFAAPAPERFRLHKFQQPIGVETDSVTKHGGNLEIESTFEFTDRGQRVPLKAAFRSADDYTPVAFTISGSTSRSSTIDIAITVASQSAKVRDRKASRDVPLPGQFFTIAGYAPTVLQETMVRYWLGHGRPSQIAILPSGTVQITERGDDTFTIQGRPARLRRFSIRGLVWGLETLWLDDQDALAAVVTRDAEFDHFEAVRERYESALPDFIAAAARDEIAHLAEIDKGLPGRQTGVLAITGATLIDGLGNPPIRPATVVMSNGRIVAAGREDAITIPDDAKRINATGKYIVPGLWDMHAHYEQVEWGPIYLAAGVTTVRDVGNEFGFITAVRDANNAGQGLGPRLLLAGIVDGDGPIALGIQRVNSATDAAAWVKRYHDAGFEQMKIYISVKPEMVRAVCQDAHALGMTVTGHIPQGMSIIDGVEAGMDQVNHLSYALQALLPKGFQMAKASFRERIKVMKSVDVHSEAAQQMIRTLKDHGTVMDDTAAVLELGTNAVDEPATTLEPGVAHVAAELAEQYNGMGAKGDSLVYRRLRWSKEMEVLSALHQAGIPFVAGTDQAVPGFSVYHELEIYVAAGFTPLEALQAATIVPARVMHVDSDTGSIETGKRADLDILDANPLEDIHNIRTVRWVVANGVLCDPAPLWRSVGFSQPR